MTKQQAQKILGAESMAEAAAMLGMSRQAFWAWPDLLKPEQADRVIGCAVRHGRKLPKRLLPKA